MPEPMGSPVWRLSSALSAYGWDFTLADPIIGLIITVVILGIVWQSAKAVLTRMLDGVEPEVDQ